MEEHIHIENNTQELDLYNFIILNSEFYQKTGKNVYPEVRHEKNIMFETASKRLPVSEYQSEGPGD